MFSTKINDKSKLSDETIAIVISKFSGIPILSNAYTDLTKDCTCKTYVSGSGRRILVRSLAPDTDASASQIGQFDVVMVQSVRPYSGILRDIDR